jgi:hypothetical protein
MGIYDEVLLVMNDLEYIVQRALAAQIKAYRESGMDEDKAEEYAIRSIRAHVNGMLARRARN